MNARVLIVDDEPAIVEGLMLLCDSESIESAGAGDRAAAVDMVAASFYPVIVADLCVRTTEEGLRMLDEIREISPRSRVVTMSGYITPDLEAEVKRRGVSMVLQKPMANEVIVAAINEMLAELERVAAAEPVADLAELYAKTHRILYSIPRKYGLAHDAAEDVVQQAWMLYLEKRGEVRNPRAWLSGTAANLCRQELRRSARISTDDPDETFETTPAVHDGELTDVLAIQRALDGLDSRSRELCTWIGIEGYSYEEISNATAMPLGSIGPIYLRAKKKLRDALSH